MPVRVKTLKLTEKQFMAQVVQLAKLRGWLVYHTFDSRRSTQGFPDLVLVRGPILLFVELKVRAKISIYQTMWNDALIEAGAHAVVWRPEDWPQIEDVLT